MQSKKTTAVQRSQQVANEPHEPATLHTMVHNELQESVKPSTSETYAKAIKKSNDKQIEAKKKPKAPVSNEPTINDMMKSPTEFQTEMSIKISVGYPRGWKIWRRPKYPEPS